MTYSANQICFIDDLAPLVQAECVKRGYHVASPILAQASVESFKGSGLSQLATKYNNYFGLKTGSSWTGKAVSLKTGEEYTKGVITQIMAKFRVYDSMQDGVKGYFDFINTKRYANLKTATTPQQYLEMIKADKYCTSSAYVSNALERIRDMGLTRYDNFSEAAPKTGNPYPEPVKNVKLNTRGNDVRWLQYALNEKGGYKLIIDGIAGPLTIGALKDFQERHGLVVDGICGPKTREALTLK